MNRRLLIAISLFFVVLITVLLLRAPTNANPSLVISFSHYDYRKDGTEGIVEVKNVGQGPACYYGFGANSPFYELMVLNDSGWTKARIFQCVSGAGCQVLHPGQKEMIRVRLPTNQTWKVNITYTKATFRDKLPRFVTRAIPAPLKSEQPTYTAWSTPVPYYAEANSEP